ncbi:hypothetical protein [Micromonospora trifolii]|uniref:hypothetical protein n=1 Tax=Micromonospora trifolii TaxID=2911208 RepID=UPI003CF44B30
MTAEWVIRSSADLGDFPMMGRAGILVQEAYLTYAPCDPPQDENDMCVLLAALYESQLNFLKQRIEVLAYARKPGKPRNEPDSVIYEIRYRPVTP